jgi:threonine dehydratase
MQAPSFTDVLSARRAIAPYLSRTPLAHYPAIDQLIGARVLIKHENHQPTGAFKVRGGVNLVSQLTADERSRGIMAASTGNHGQSVAYGAQLFGVQAKIVVPEEANPLKVAAMRNYGAEVLFHGQDFDEARVRCEVLAREKNMRYIHSANEPLLIAGVGTLALEIFEDAPQVNTIFVPVGGGSGAAGACLVAKQINPNVKVVGVQAERAPAAYKSWRAKELLEDEMATAAEGLATRVGFELTQRMLWEMLDDFVLVTEEEIQQALMLYIEKAHSLAEAAGSATLAAAIKMRGELPGQTIALVLSGGNVTLDQLRSALATLPGPTSPFAKVM